MARRTAKQARKSKAKTARRTPQSKGRKGAKKAKKATRKPARATAPRKTARVTGSASRRASRSRKTAAKMAKPRRKVVAPVRPETPPPPDRRPRNPPASLNRVRKTLGDDNVPTPPSSLDMHRSASAARSGRAEIAENQKDHRTMTPAITGGDVDANIENAYFSGDEAPGGDNPTPDQDIVDDIGRAMGVQYQDNEELQSGDKVAERDKHRWELDPASSEDYRDRK